LFIDKKNKNNKVLPDKYLNSMSNQSGIMCIKNYDKHFLRSNMNCMSLFFSMTFNQLVFCWHLMDECMKSILLKFTQQCIMTSTYCGLLAQVLDFWGFWVYMKSRQSSQCHLWRQKKVH